MSAYSFLLSAMFFGTTASIGIRQSSRKAFFCINALKNIDRVLFYSHPIVVCLTIGYRRHDDIPSIRHPYTAQNRLTMAKEQRRDVAQKSSRGKFHNVATKIFTAIFRTKRIHIKINTYLCLTICKRIGYVYTFAIIYYSDIKDKNILI